MRPTEPHLLEPATTTYENDWKGTAAAENSMIVGSGDLKELAGLGQEWTVLAVNAFAHSHGAPPDWTVQVYAANRGELGVESFESWAEIAAEHGGVPVTEVLVHDATLDDVIRCMKVFDVQIKNPNVPSLLVTQVADHPEQE